MSSKNLKKVMLAAAFSVYFSAYGAEPFYFFVDLDGVILEKPTVQVPSEGTVTFGEQRFKIVYGAGSFIQSLLNYEGAKVVFFSHAPEERNLEALRNVKLPNGSTALSVASAVLSNTLIDESTWGSPLHSEIRPFSGGYKKDLLKGAPDINLNRAVLIDDQPGYAAKGQEPNLLWLFPYEAYGRELTMTREDYDVFLSEDGKERVEMEGQSRLLALNRLNFALGLIDAAFERASKASTTVPQALKQIQWGDKWQYQIFKPEKRADFVSFMRKGTRLLRSANPNKSGFTPLFKTSTCKRLLG
jgi:hypothetical protein